MSIAFAVIGAAPALAGVGGAVGPTWPVSVQVGQVFSGYIDIYNMSNGINASEFISVSAINFTPSCAAGTGGGCTAPDPGVFSFTSPIGAPGTACSGVFFNLQPPNPATGEIALLPSKAVRLGPSDGSGGSQSPPNCRIVINASLLKMPQDSNATTGAITTLQYARAVLVGEVSRSTGAALGQGTITVVGASVNLSASGGNKQVVLNWSSTPALATYTYKLVFSTGSAPASCATGTVLLNGSTATTFTHTGRQNGTTYFYRVCASDSASGSTATDAASATPGDANQPPVAQAGPDKSAQTQTSISFDGGGSTDPDGNADIATYAWTFGDGASASGKSVSHAYAAAGTYTATLTVTDQAGASSSDTTTVTITNRPPVANAGPNQSSQTLTLLTFNGSSSSDPDGTITSFAWTFGDGTTGTGATTSHAYASAGTYAVTLTVTDNNGATASDTASVTIANRPPTANAGPDQNAAAGGAVTLNGSGSTDPDGVIANYSWSFGDGTSFNAGNVASASHTYAAAGTYTATLTVTDNNGASASDTAVITVTNTAPVGGTFKWSARYGGSGGSVVGYATAVDSAGNVIVAGAFWGTVNVGGNSLASAGSADIVVAKYSPTGAHLWSKRFGSTFDDIAYGVVVDGGGNVIVAGSYSGTVNFGGGTMTAPGTAKGDVFVVKFTPAGDHLWSKGFGGGGDDGAHGVAVDSGGNVVVTGCFNGAAAFGSVVLTSAFNSTDAFLAKLTPAGVLSWAKSFGGSGIDCGNGVGIDGAGNITLVGSFMGPADFGGGAGSLAGFGISDVVLARYSPAGVHLWSRQFGGGGDDAGYAVAVDANGNAAVTGYVQGTVDFGGGNTASLGSIDTFVAKYNANGAHVWSRRLGSTNAEQGFGVAMDSSGNVFLGGTFQGSVDFGTGVLNSAGGWDILAAKYSPSGVALWSKAFGDTGDDYAYGVATDSGGNSIFTGMFHGTVNFGGGDFTSAGWIDMFIVKFGP